MFSILLITLLGMAVSGGPYYTSRRLTAAADVNLVREMYLREIRVYGGATPGSFSWLLDGTGARAHFSTPTDGTRGYASYKVNFKVEGTTIPSATFELLGGVSFVELMFSDDAPGAGHLPLSKWRAIRFARTDAGAVTGTVTGTFPGAKAKPLWVLGYISASAGRATFPLAGNVQMSHEAIIASRAGEAAPVPNIPESQTLDLSIITDAASTSQYLVGY